MNQLLVKDDESVSLEPLIPEMLSQVRSFDLTEVSFYILDAKRRLFRLSLRDGFVLCAFTGDK